LIKPSHLDKEKIYKTKDIIPLLKFYGNSFDKIKTNHPNRARAIILGYRVHRSGLSEAQLREVIGEKIEDRAIADILEHKELKSIRTWSVSSKLPEDEKAAEILKIWCQKLGAICLIGNLTQKDIISLANDRFKDALDCSVPKEF
jgi:hypothetical protein